MNLPILPTDNFYKFTALSGLAIIVFCIIFPFQRINEINLKIAEIDTQRNILEIDIENIENNLLDALATKGISNTKKQALVRNSLEYLLKRNDIKELSKDFGNGEPVLNIKEQAIFRTKNNEIKKRLAKIKGEEKKLIILYDELSRYHWILWIGGWIGLILFLSGLFLWFALTQRPNDIILQKQMKGESISPPTPH